MNLRRSVGEAPTCRERRTDRRARSHRAVRVRRTMPGVSSASNWFSTPSVRSGNGVVEPRECVVGTRGCRRCRRGVGHPSTPRRCLCQLGRRSRTEWSSDTCERIVGVCPSGRWHPACSGSPWAWLICVHRRRDLAMRGGPVHPRSNRPAAVRPGVGRTVRQTVEPSSEWGRCAPLRFATLQGRRSRC